MSAASLTPDELVRLIEVVFAPRTGDRALAVLVDQPDENVPDHPAWAERRRIAAEWTRVLGERRGGVGLDRVELLPYANVRRNNAEIPAVDSLLDGYDLVIALTEFSATAPLKLAARRRGFRAATMPGFGPAMIPALRLDWAEVDRRCSALKQVLDEARTAQIRFEVGGQSRELTLDLRFRSATASGGRITEPGTAGNLPSGETFIVPYEGERPDEPSASAGVLPLELDGELLEYRIEGNKAVEVVGDGPLARREREEIRREPAYANVSELGLGVLADLGIRPIGELLLDEKLGLHIAFGRSDHFGGAVGVADFSSPGRAVHIDRVYIPEVQPAIRVRSVELDRPGLGTLTLIRDDAYVAEVFGAK